MRLLRGRAIIVCRFPPGGGGCCFRASRGAGETAHDKLIMDCRDAGMMRFEWRVAGGPRLGERAGRGITASTTRWRDWSTFSHSGPFALGTGTKRDILASNYYGL